MNEKTLTQIEATEAWLQGKQVEWKILTERDDWKVITIREQVPYNVLPSPLTFYDKDLRFRLAPTPPAQVPWEGPNDVPAGLMWIRSLKVFDKTYCVSTITIHGFETYAGSIYWLGLMDWEWSDASRKVWLPCTKESTPDTK